jgi:hypothetical protein
MNARMKNTTWMCAALVLTVVTGAPVIADDTELLLATPQGYTGKPNVLFIIDTSGSMKKNEPSTAPYKAATPYGGACIPARYYWSKDGSLPDCATTTNFINGNQWSCQKAAHHFAGLGYYKGVMAQMRRGDPGGTGPWRWQELAPGHNTWVDCEADFGIHGDGTANLFWPIAGSRNNMGGASSFRWTDDPASTGRTTR